MNSLRRKPKSIASGRFLQSGHRPCNESKPSGVIGGYMTTSTRIRIMTVDDHPLLLEGLARVIRSQPDMVLAGQASNCRDAIQQFSTLRPDVTVMDLRLPDMSGIEGLIAIQTQFPEARIIMMTTFEGDVPVGRALDAGACSYIFKSMPPSGVLDTIRHVHAGRKRLPPEIAIKLAEHLGDEKLTNREVDILRQTAVGNRNREIGANLFISEGTVKVHMKNIMEKLGARDRTQAVAIAARRGFIQL
jgi:DNA-binding NarL/FixJ family response regulator